MRLWIPGVQRLACYGVTEEVRQSTVLAIPIRQYFRCEVKILPITCLLVDHQQRFQYGHGRHSFHDGCSHIAQRDSTTADDINPVVHLGHHRIKNRPITRDLVRHEHPPDAIFAVPEVPVRVPSKPLPAGLAVSDVDEVLVGITAEIAVRILILHETVAFFADEGKKLLVLKVVGDAGGGQHLLPPELTTPEATNLRLVVIAELERLARFVEHLIAHDGINKPTRDEAIHLCAKPPLKANILERRAAHRVWNCYACRRDKTWISHDQHCREKRKNNLMSPFHDAHYSITHQVRQEKFRYIIAILLVLFRQAIFCYTSRLCEKLQSDRCWCSCT